MDSKVPNNIGRRCFLEHLLFNSVAGFVGYVFYGKLLGTSEQGQLNKKTVYRNFNIQIRKNKLQDFYWETRPFGNPMPQSAKKFEGFIFENVTYSDDGLIKTVETVWDSKESFLKTLPPEHFEQPGFDEWHKRKNITFSWHEEYVDANRFHKTEKRIS